MYEPYDLSCAREEARNPCIITWSTIFKDHTRTYNYAALWVEDLQSWIVSRFLDSGDVNSNPFTDRELASLLNVHDPDTGVYISTSYKSMKLVNP